MSCAAKGDRRVSGDINLAVVSFSFYRMPAPIHQPAPLMLPPPLPVSRSSAHPCTGDGCSCAIFAVGAVSATYCTCGHPQQWHSAQGRKGSVSVSGSGAAGGHRGSGSAPSSPSSSPAASPSSARRGLKPPPFMPAAAAESRRPSASPPPLPCSLSLPVSHFSATYPPAASSAPVVPLPSPAGPSPAPAAAAPPSLSRPSSTRVSAGGSMYSAYLVKHGLVSSVPPPPPPQLLQPPAAAAPHSSPSLSAPVPPPLPANSRSASVCTSPPPIPSSPVSPGFLSPPARTQSVSVANTAADMSSPKRSQPPPVPLFPPSLSTASAASSAPADSARVSALKLNRPPPIIPPAPAAASSAPPSASPPPSSSPTAPSSSAVSPAPPSLSPDAFATHLHHKADVVSLHSAAGLQLVKAMRSFFHSFSTLQQRHASDVERLIQSEVQRLSSSCQQDDVGSAHCLHNVYVSLLMKVGSAGVKAAGCGHDVSLQCVDLLDSFCHAGGGAVREHEAEVRRQATAMEKLQATVAKEREVARQALSSLAHKRERESAGTAALDAARRKALRSCEGYERAIETANLSYAQHQQRELPALLSQMQTLEEMRLQSLQTALASFASLSCAFSSSLSAVGADLKQLVGSVNAEQDIKCFISRVIQEHGPPLPAQPFSYDMAVTAAELRQEIEAEERLAAQQLAAAATGAGAAAPTAAGGGKRQASLFYTTLEDVMEYERRLLDDPAASVACSSLPAWPADVPRLLLVLLSAIESLGGFTSEGIFRLSVPSDALHSARKQLDSGQYASLLQLSDPHVPAAVLKAWLRDLSEPLVPFASYDRCIEIGRAGSEDADASIASVLSLASGWPALNRRVLFVLLQFLHRLSSGPWVEQSRMTRANLAIVFAPGLLRSESSDPAVLMRDSKHACQAVALLIESAGRETGWEEERRWKAQWDSRSGGRQPTTAGAARNRGSVAVVPPPVPAEYRSSPSPSGSPPLSPSTGGRVSFADRHAALAPPQAVLDGAAPVVVHGQLPPSPAKAAEGGLPPLWRAQLDPATQTEYFYNIATLQSQWNRP